MIEFEAKPENCSFNLPTEVIFISASEDRVHGG